MNKRLQNELMLQTSSNSSCNILNTRVEQRKYDGTHSKGSFNERSEGGLDINTEK